MVFYDSFKTLVLWIWKIAQFNRDRLGGVLWKACLNMLLPKQSAIFLIYFQTLSFLFWTCFYRSNLLSTMFPVLAFQVSFEHASTEAICYHRQSRPCRHHGVLNMLLPKQSAITCGNVLPDRGRFWTCFYRSNLLSITLNNANVPVSFEHASTEAICYPRNKAFNNALKVLNMLLPKQSAIHTI